MQLKNFDENRLRVCKINCVIVIKPLALQGKRGDANQFKSSFILPGNQIANF